MRARIAYQRLNELITIRSAIARRRETAWRCVGSSAAFLPPSPPAEKATARQDEAGQASTDDGTGTLVLARSERATNAQRERREGPPGAAT